MTPRRQNVFTDMKTYLLLTTDLSKKKDPVCIYLQCVYSHVYNILLNFWLPTMTVVQPIPVLMVIWPEGHSWEISSANSRQLTISSDRCSLSCGSRKWNDFCTNKCQSPSGFSVWLGRCIILFFILRNWNTLHFFNTIKHMFIFFEGGRTLGRPDRWWKMVHYCLETVFHLLNQCGFVRMELLLA